jgi:hypothetical protein
VQIVDKGKGFKTPIYSDEICPSCIKRLKSLKKTTTQEKISGMMESMDKVGNIIFNK